MKRKGKKKGMYFWECENCQKPVGYGEMEVVFKKKGSTGIDDHYMIHKACGCIVSRIED